MTRSCRNDLYTIYNICIYLLLFVQWMVSPTSSISTIYPAMPASAVQLTGVSAHMISTVLENLGFSSLVAPFMEIGVDGRMISEMKSFDDFLEIIGGKMIVGNEVAIALEAFFDGHVRYWQSSGMVPFGRLLRLVAYYYLCMIYIYVLRIFYTRELTNKYIISFYSAYRW